MTFVRVRTSGGWHQAFFVDDSINAAALAPRLLLGTHVRSRKERVRVSSSMKLGTRENNWFTSHHVSTHNKHIRRAHQQSSGQSAVGCRNVSTMRGIHQRVSVVLLLLWVHSLPALVTTWHTQHCCWFQARLGAKGEMPLVHVSSYVPRSNECKIFFYLCAPTLMVWFTHWSLGIQVCT